jgi:hypothetical protein
MNDQKKAVKKVECDATNRRHEPETGVTIVRIHVVEVFGRASADERAVYEKDQNGAGGEPAPCLRAM